MRVSTRYNPNKINIHRSPDGGGHACLDSCVRVCVCSRARAHRFCCLDRSLLNYPGSSIRLFELQRTCDSLVVPPETCGDEIALEPETHGGNV